jgi:hypothetical protein
VPDTLPSAYSNGTFTVTNALDPRAESATFQIIAPPPADLSTSVTTDKSVYEYGEPVKLTLTETNVSSQPIVVLTGETAFEITHDGADQWSPGPSAVAASASWETLQPGQSYVQTATRNSSVYTVTSPNATGTFTATNLLDPNGSSATFQITSAVYIPPGQPAPPPVTNSPIPTPIGLPVTATLASSQSAYKPGQSVHFTMTLKNLSTAKVPVKPNVKLDGITVMDGSAVVYRSNHLRPMLAARSIKPHQSIKLGLAWSGRANQKDVSKLAPGTYTVQVVDGGYVGTTTVRIVS